MKAFAPLRHIDMVPISCLAAPVSSQLTFLCCADVNIALDELDVLGLGIFRDQINRAAASFARDIAGRAPLVANAFGSIEGETAERGMVVPSFAGFSQHALGIDEFERPETFDRLTTVSDPSGVIGRHAVGGVAPALLPAAQPILPPEDPGAAADSITDDGLASHGIPPSVWGFGKKDGGRRPFA